MAEVETPVQEHPENGASVQFEGSLTAWNGSFPESTVDAAFPRSRVDGLAALHCVGDAVILSDGAGRVEYLNPAAEALTGWSPAEAIGRRTREVLCMEPSIPGYVFRGEGCHGLRATGTAEAVHQEAWVVSRDGRRTLVDLASSLMRMGDGPVRGMVRILRDTTATPCWKRATGSMPWSSPAPTGGLCTSSSPICACPG